MIPAWLILYITTAALWVVDLGLMLGKPPREIVAINMWGFIFGLMSTVFAILVNEVFMIIISCQLTGWFLPGVIRITFKK